MSTKYKFDLQGHRGARGLRPENTLPAFLLALELGVTTLEMDVVISADKHVVVSHDPWFNPLVSDLEEKYAEERAPNIYEMTYEEIRSINVGARQHPLFPKQIPLPVYKPLLDDVIRHAEAFAKEIGRKPVYYNIETKCTPDGDNSLHPEPEEFTELLLNEIDHSRIADRTTIQSFDQRTLIAAKASNTECLLSLLIDKIQGGHLENRINELGFLPEIISPDYKLVDSGFLDDARRIGMQVLPWTVNTRDEMIRLLEMGVDGLITDYPDIGMTLLESHQTPD